MNQPITVKALKTGPKEYPWVCGDCGRDAPNWRSRTMYLVNGQAKCAGHALYDVQTLMAVNSLEACLSDGSDAR